MATPYQDTKIAIFLFQSQAEGDFFPLSQIFSLKANVADYGQVVRREVTVGALILQNRVIKHLDRRRNKDEIDAVICWADEVAATQIGVSAAPWLGE